MMYGKRPFIALVILVTIVISIVVIIPMLHIDRTPNWGEDGSKFLYDIDKALKKYSSAQKGNTPSTLASLYPDYIDDKRVVAETPLFAGKRMAIIYWRPQKLGDANIPVVQLVLDPSVKTYYPRNTFILWGDGKVQLCKKK